MDKNLKEAGESGVECGPEKEEKTPIEVWEETEHEDPDHPYGHPEWMY